MTGRPLCIGMIVILLTSCSGKTPTEPDVDAGTGAILDTKTEIYDEENIDTMLLNEAEEARKETYATLEDALLLSYQNAVRVRDVIRGLIPDLDPNVREPMEKAVLAFSDDIAEFGDLVDIAQSRTLTPEEQLRVMELSATIEDGMEAFAQIVEVMP